MTFSILKARFPWLLQAWKSVIQIPWPFQVFHDRINPVLFVLQFLWTIMHNPTKLPECILKSGRLIFWIKSFPNQGGRQISVPRCQFSMNLLQDQGGMAALNYGHVIHLAISIAEMKHAIGYWSCIKEIAVHACSFTLAWIKFRNLADNNNNSSLHAFGYHCKGIDLF